MLPYIELYIGNMRVEFANPIEIHLTYTHEDLHNPTIVKNSYSKTVTIDGTPNNNKIFGLFYDMQREIADASGLNTGAYYNPSKKVPFALYRNGDRIEHGYCKLDNVKKVGNRVQYNITLYGGLGQFLYGLSYKEDGEPMKLSDLDYGGGETEFDLEINKNTIRRAWNQINGIKTHDAIYDKINFAPCYNGIPENFNADKVAIYAKGFYDSDDFAIYNQFITSKDGYTTVDGWLLGELSKDYDEWQMKDLRSYLQRPVFRFKEVIDACCDKKNNGGYTVDLDPEFFNDDNPYYNNAWMTLPLVTEVENFEKDNEALIEYNNGKFTIVNPNIGDTIRFEVPFNLMAESDSAVSADYRRLFTGVWSGTLDVKTNTAYYVQLVAYNSKGEAVAGSNVLSFYTSVGNLKSFAYDLEFNAPVTEVLGDFFRLQAEQNFKFEVEQKLGVDVKCEDGMYFKLIVKQSVIEELSNGYGGILFTSTSSRAIPITDARVFADFNIGKVSLSTQGKSGKKITKQTLLNSEKSVADYFLSYIKMFNLHIWQSDDDTIMVRLRKNYFTGEEYDLEDLIDRGSEIDINPLTFDAKYYTFTSEYEVDSNLYKVYKDDYGIAYGMKKVDTNYNFDMSSKNLFENNVFKGCITSRNRSKYYTDIYQSFDGDDAFYPPFMLDGVQTYLFKDGDTLEGAYLTPKTTIIGNNWWDMKYYDLTPKPNFTDEKNEPIDGANVLLFYNGNAQATDKDGKSMRIQISDDIPQFETLNGGEPCWIWSYTFLDESSPLKLPIFGRHITNENGWVTHSWDFGTPKALFIPDYQIDETSNLYTQFWQPYIRDRYNVNTRVATCKVLLREQVVGDWLRRFYFWDGSWWIMNKITDYNPVENGTTKCEMVKINDPQNYR